MNCGHINTYEIPFGVEWREHLKTCKECGCCRFSDHYKNIEDYEERRSATLEVKEIKEIADRLDLVEQIAGLEGKRLDCRGIDVTPTPQFIRIGSDV